jgi:hypothetical protein
MPSVTGTQSTPATCLRDKTPPPAPQISQSIAFDKAASNATVDWGSDGGPSAGRRDPAYIELTNVEIGTTFEVINLSANPHADFDKKNTVSLKPTGRDVANRTASVYLKQSQMEKLGLKPGDMYLLRAVDANGNASAPVLGELEPNDWGNMRVVENIRGRTSFSRGTRLNALDGEGARKDVIAKAVNDARPPVILEEHVSLARSTGKKIKVQFDAAVEPGARVQVQNQRTGETRTVTVPMTTDRQLEVPLTAEDGDPLVLHVWDNENNQGKSLDLVYSSKCKDGKAKRLAGGLAARLPGVID